MAKVWQIEIFKLFKDCNSFFFFKELAGEWKKEGDIIIEDIAVSIKIENLDLNYRGETPLQKKLKNLLFS